MTFSFERRFFLKNTIADDCSWSRVSRFLSAKPTRYYRETPIFAFIIENGCGLTATLAGTLTLPVKPISRRWLLATSFVGATFVGMKIKCPPVSSADTPNSAEDLLPPVTESGDLGLARTASVEICVTPAPISGAQAERADIAAKRRYILAIRASPRISPLNVHRNTKNSTKKPRVAGLLYFSAGENQA